MSGEELALASAAPGGCVGERYAPRAPVTDAFHHCDGSQEPGHLPVVHEHNDVRCVSSTKRHRVGEPVLRAPPKTCIKGIRVSEARPTSCVIGGQSLNLFEPGSANSFCKGPVGK